MTKIKDPNNIRVHFPRGACGSFLTNCFKFYTNPEYFLNLPSVSTTGDAHPQEFDLSDIGKTIATKLKTHSVFQNFNTHSPYLQPDNFTTVFIKSMPEDYEIIADMFVSKVLINKLNEDEYNHIKDFNWAPFEKWTTCEVTKQILKDRWAMIGLHTDPNKGSKDFLDNWNKKADFSKADYIINFKDLHFDPLLSERISEIVKKPVNKAVNEYIQKYRDINRRYWK